MKSTVFFFALIFAAITAYGQDSYGVIKSTTKMRPDGTNITTVTDPENHSYKEIVADASGKVLRRAHYQLGDRDLPVEATFSDGKGKVIYKATYQRDGLDRIIEAKFTGPDGGYLGKRRFIFDRGETARVEDYDAQGVLIARPQAVSKAPAKGSVRR